MVYRKVVVFFSPTYFVSCNGPCAPKEKWHRKELIIIIIKNDPHSSAPLQAKAAYTYKSLGHHLHGLSEQRALGSRHQFSMLALIDRRRRLAQKARGGLANAHP